MNAARALIVVGALLALQGCGVYTIDDGYGNNYGSFFDFGTQYSWQLATCKNDIAVSNVAPPNQQRWMQCCMWRHGAPITDSNGCEAPPYAG